MISIFFTRPKKKVLSCMNIFLPQRSSEVLVRCRACNICSSRSLSLTVSLIYKYSVMHGRGSGKVHKALLRHKVNLSVYKFFEVSDNTSHSQKTYFLVIVVWHQYVKNIQALSIGWVARYFLIIGNSFDSSALIITCLFFAKIITLWLFCDYMMD